MTTTSVIASEVCRDDSSVEFVCVHRKHGVCNKILPLRDSFTSQGRFSQPDRSSLVYTRTLCQALLGEVTLILALPPAHQVSAH